ncbi:hypothetical protein LXL04_004937 [Taraxacum kok-saghyz]
MFTAIHGNSGTSTEELHGSIYSPPDGVRIRRAKRGIGGGQEISTGWNPAGGNSVIPYGGYSPFEIVFYPRASMSEFCVKASLVKNALQIRWSPAMRFKMPFHTVGSSIRVDAPRVLPSCGVSLEVVGSSLARTKVVKIQVGERAAIPGCPDTGPVSNVPETLPFDLCNTLKSAALAPLLRSTPPPPIDGTSGIHRHGLLLSTAPPEAIDASTPNITYHTAGITHFLKLLCSTISELSERVSGGIKSMEDSSGFEDVFVSIPHGGPIYIADMVGPLSSVSQFHSCIQDELKVLHYP